MKDSISRHTTRKGKLYDRICAEMCALAIRAEVKLSQLLPGQWLPWETQGEENEGGAPGEDGVYLCTCVFVYLGTCVLVYLGEGYDN